MSGDNSTAGAAHPLHGLCKTTGAIARWAGHLSALVMLLLTAALVLGVALRLIGIDNSWTYDLATFAMIWLAFVGAAYTALRDGHVNAGVSLEHMLGHRGRALAILRFVIVALFLIAFLISAWQQFYTSFHFDETTLDLVKWPLWVARAALPLGALAWLAAELHKLLQLLMGEAAPKAESDPSALL